MIKVIWLCKSDTFVIALKSFLEKENISIVSICKKTNEALEQFVNNKADLIVMDANWGKYHSADMTEPTGISILQEFLKYDNAIKVIFVTASYERRLAEKIKEAGAKGNLHRNNHEDIANCITHVYNGEYYFSPNPKT